MTQMDPPAGSGDPPPARPAVTEAEIQQVLDALPVAAPVAQLDPQTREAAQRHRLRGVYGWALLGFLAAQVIVADVAFFLYTAWGVHRRVPPTVMSAWLAATVVEVIGVVYAVTRSLFPLSDTAPLDLHKQ